MTNPVDGSPEITPDVPETIGADTTETPAGPEITEEEPAETATDTVLSEQAIEPMQTDEPEQRNYDPTGEVPALLGNIEPTGSTPEAMPAAEPVIEKTVSAEPAPLNTVLTVDHPACDELKEIRLLVQGSLANTETIVARMDAVYTDTDCLIKQVNALSGKQELLVTNIESLATATADSATPGALPKTFMTVAAAVVAVLIIFQIYIFVSLIKIQRWQNVDGSAVLQNMSSLNKKMAGYEKSTVKPAEHPTAPTPTPAPALAGHAPAVAENSGHGTRTPVATEAAPSPVPAIPVQERLNRLRNGLPEKKLIRKETGDWFTFNKKSEECIADTEVIEALNQAYRKIGRPLQPGFPMPVHNALCLLKPDGKGGTEIVMTKDFLQQK